MTATQNKDTWLELMGGAMSTLRRIQYTLPELESLKRNLMLSYDHCIEFPRLHPCVSKVLPL